MQNSTISNKHLRNYSFLEDMYEDDYFPTFLVDKCKAVLIELCEQIEAQKVTEDEDVLALTHAATEKLNDLAHEFEENDSEIETGARESLCADFETILNAYDLDIDVEDAVAPRDW